MLCTPLHYLLTNINECTTLYSLSAFLVYGSSCVHVIFVRNVCKTSFKVKANFMESEDYLLYLLSN